jgi:carbonic anhydrase
LRANFFCFIAYNSNDHNGPENWHTSCPGWEICKSGKFQSPINIVTENASKISSIENRINASFVQVGNSGSVKDLSHTVEVIFDTFLHIC